MPMTPNQRPYMPPQFPNMNRNFFPPMQPFPQNSPFQKGIGGFGPMFNFPTFAPSPMTFNRNFINNNRNIQTAHGHISNQKSNKNQIFVFSNTSNFNDDFDDVCSFQ